MIYCRNTTPDYKLRAKQMWEVNSFLTFLQKTTNLIRSNKSLFFLMVLTSICTSSYSQKTQSYSVSQSEIEKYIKLNNNEHRLLEYKDDKTSLLLKLQQLHHINASRKKYKKDPVELDILASRVANKISKQAAQKKFMGHFNTDGESPYHRYAFAGGTHHIVENASAISANQKLPAAENDITAYMQQLHNAFMAEKAPNDGHKQNCIHPHHNFVGIGYYIYNNQFRYYEEFVDQYLKFGDFQETVTINQSVNLPVKPVKNKHLYMALAYYEKKTGKMSVAAINRKKVYNDYTSELTHQILPWNLPQQNNEGYTPLRFTFTKKGLYYIQIFVDDKPYSGGKATTKNKIQASGVVIEVE
ncbi:CAP domain-containing protein [Labilibacter sediminis]|nr:CAP domain-containing protein [Labilibacter sediminis]